MVSSFVILQPNSAESSKKQNYFGAVNPFVAAAGAFVPADTGT
jgi:hypothetical protein